MAEKTRIFSINGKFDAALCERHAQWSQSKGIELGVPIAAASYMMGLKPWPTGKEPCGLCLKEGKDA